MPKNETGFLSLPTPGRPHLVAEGGVPSANSSAKASIRAILSGALRDDGPTDTDTPQPTAAEDEARAALTARAQAILDGHLGQDPEHVRHIVTASNTLMFDALETLIPYVAQMRQEIASLETTLATSRETSEDLQARLSDSQALHDQRDQHDADTAASHEIEIERLQIAVADLERTATQQRDTIRRLRESEEAARRDAEHARHELLKIKEIVVDAENWVITP